MNTVCGVCGDSGFKHLLLLCSDCNGAPTHQYCLDKILFDASLADWFCDECQPRHGEVAYSNSLGKVSSETPPSHAHFGLTSQQPIARRVESARVAGPWGHRKSMSMAKSACLKKTYSSRLSSLRKKCIRKQTNIRGKGINRRGRNAASIACTSGKALYSCETIATETAKGNNRDNQPVDNENPVQTLNNDRGPNHLSPRLKQLNHPKPLETHSNVIEHFNVQKGQVGSVSSLEDNHPNPLIVNCLGYTLGDADQSHLLKPLEGLPCRTKKAPQSLTAPFKGLVMKTNKVVSRSKNLESLNLTTEKGNSILDNSNESEPSKLNECSVTGGVTLKVGNTPLDEERRGEVMIAGSQNTSSSNVNFTRDHPNKQYNSWKAKESPNPRSALECNRTSQNDLRSNIRKLPISVGKVPASQLSGFKDNSGAILSSKHTDHDKHTNQHAPVGCKNMKTKPGKANRTVAGAHQNMYLAAASLRNKDKPEAQGDSNGNVLDGLTMEREKREVRFQLDYKANYELQQRSMAANVCVTRTPVSKFFCRVRHPASVSDSDTRVGFRVLSAVSQKNLPNRTPAPESDTDTRTRVRVTLANVPQPSILQNDALDKAMSDSSNVGVLPKANCLPSVHSENDNLKENQSEPSKLLDRPYSSPSLEISSKESFILEASATEAEIPDAAQSLGKENPKKRRRLILLCDDDDDQDEEEKAEDVQQKNVNPRPLKSDGSMTKHRIDAEYYVEEAVQPGDLNDQNLVSVRPVKRQRRYIVEMEDDEGIFGAADADCALNDATNCSLNDAAKLALQPIVGKDHPLQPGTASDSESADQKYYIYSQPLDEPIWSGVFKIDNEVFVKLDAHLSNKACQRVCELSRSLQPVVEVMKLPRLQAWPKRWTSSGPTDDSIGLFFFPHGLRSNEVSGRVINKIIESDGALKVTVGIAELLIFPSVLLPEQYHFFQGKHYLWGVFKRRAAALVEEQDDSAHATEEGKLHEHDILAQQDEVLYESSDQETFVVKHAVHAENQLLVERDPDAQKEAVKVVTREDITSHGSGWSSAKPNSPKSGSNYSVQPRIDHKLHAPGDMDQQEDFTRSSLEWSALSITDQSSESGLAAVATNLIKPAERADGEPHSGSEPSKTELFGFVAARTPRSQQLIQEIASEGALLSEGMVTADSSTGANTGVGAVSELNHDSECPHLQERPQAFDFVSTGHGEPGAASDACLELFPVRQEHIGWAPRVEVSEEVDLDLSLGKCSRGHSMPLF